jgi:hypothetical protein
MAFLSGVEHLPFQASHLYDEQDSRVSTGRRKKPWVDTYFYNNDRWSNCKSLFN